MATPEIANPGGRLDIGQHCRARWQRFLRPRNSESQFPHKTPRISMFPSVVQRLPRGSLANAVSAGTDVCFSGLVFSMR